MIEQAVTIRRQLAKGRPDVFLPDLAGSLRDLAYVPEHARTRVQGDEGTGGSRRY